MHSFGMNEKCVGMQVGPQNSQMHFQVGSRDSYSLKKNYRLMIIITISFWLQWVTLAVENFIISYDKWETWICASLTIEIGI